MSRFDFVVEMYVQWNSIAIPLFDHRKMAGETEQFSITLPIEAIEMIEEGLIPFGLYGKKRGTVAANLILDMLKQPAVRDIVEKHRKPTS